MVNLVQLGKLTGFTQNKEGVWRYRERICVLEGNGLRNRILEEAHRSEFTVHPGIKKNISKSQENVLVAKHEIGCGEPCE